MHPMTKAQILAGELDSDPIAAAQIKEHLSVERIVELLNLTPDEVWSAFRARDEATD